MVTVTQYAVAVPFAEQEILLVVPPPDATRSVGLTEAQGDVLLRRALAIPGVAAQMRALTDAALPVAATEPSGRTLRCRGGRVYRM